MQNSSEKSLTSIENYLNSLSDLQDQDLSIMGELNNSVDFMNDTKSVNINSNAVYKSQFTKVCSLLTKTICNYNKTNINKIDTSMNLGRVRSVVCGSSFCEQNSQVAGNKKSLKRTDKKTKIGKVEFTIYTGPRGGEYVKIDKKYKALSSIKK